jgi:hypothetical protein
MVLLQDKRPPVHTVEARRQSRLQQLQALVPIYPSHLLAEYKQTALNFDCYQVRGVTSDLVRAVLERSKLDNLCSRLV